MREIDFLTALGRLLRDGGARAAFACDPAALAIRLGVRADDRAAFVRVAPADLEAQALVLLRKRFRAATTFLPATCAGLATRSWPLFLKHARTGWPESAAADALAFCRWLRERGEGCCAREFHRLHFATAGARVTFHLVRNPARRAPTLQVLVRRGRRLHEWLVWLGW